MAKKELVCQTRADVEELEIIDAEFVDEDENPERTRMLEELAQRRATSMEKGQIDNSNLYAGSSLRYYCKYCGVLTAVIAESDFFSRPSRKCSDCKELEKHGWHDLETPSFPCSNPRR